MRALFDTNILVDYLSGVGEALAELKRFDHPTISIITWLEVLAGVRGEDEDRKVRRFLKRFDRVELDEGVAEEALRLRREKRVQLPDAIIWASARTSGALFVTRNTKDFPTDDPQVRIPYKL
jgi:hypothetical protein